MAKPRKEGAAETAAAPVDQKTTDTVIAETAGAAPGEPTVTQDPIASATSASPEAAPATDPQAAEAKPGAPPLPAASAAKVNHTNPIALEAAVRTLGEPTVTMTIPKQAHGGPVLVRRQDQSIVAVPEGIREVPVSIADHWYLKAAGARRYVK